MKIPATFFMLLVSQIAAADFAARVAAGRVPPASKEVADYYTSVMSSKIQPVLRICAPPGANTATTDWVLRLVGTVLSTGKLGDLEAEPANAITTCMMEQLAKAAPTTPPAGIIGDQGLPMLVEVTMKADTGALPRGVRTVTPVFSQLVGFMMPTGFAKAFENTGTTSYLQESTLNGESVNQWTQMITLSGGKDEVRGPTTNPITYAEKAAARFQRACPGNFTTQSMGNLKISGHDAFIALLGCGTVRSGAPTSEVAMVISIKGRSDMYTIQWAERSPPSNQAPRLDENKWRMRFQQLGTIRLCERAPDEVEPYASCVVTPAQ